MILMTKLSFHGELSQVRELKLEKGSRVALEFSDLVF